MMTQVLGSDVGLDEGVGAARVAGRGVDVGVVETPRDRPAFDDEFDVEAGQQDSRRAS